MGKGQIPCEERFHLSHSVFQRLILQTLENLGLFWKGLVATRTFMCLGAKLCYNTREMTSKSVRQ